MHQQVYRRVLLWTWLPALVISLTTAALGAVNHQKCNGSTQCGGAGTPAYHNGVYVGTCNVPPVTISACAAQENSSCHTSSVFCTAGSYTCWINGGPTVATGTVNGPGC